MRIIFFPFQLKKKKVASCTFYTFLSFVSEFDVTCKLMNFVSSRRMVLRADKDLNIKVITFLFSFSVRPHSLFRCNNKNNNTNNNNNKIYSYFLSFFLPSWLSFFILFSSFFRFSLLFFLLYFSFISCCLSVFHFLSKKQTKNKIILIMIITPCNILLLLLLLLLLLKTWFHSLWVSERRSLFQEMICRNTMVS